jgi:transcriptional regulator with XRE-family HTH domain
MLLVPRLRATRERAILSQSDLAKRAGVSKTTIVKAEQGTGVRFVTIRRLADALGVAPEELLPPES